MTEEDTGMEVGKSAGDDGRVCLFPPSLQEDGFSSYYRHAR